MEGHGQYKLLGETRDDAAGETFDKVAKLLNLGYPGGPLISQRARNGNPRAFDLPRPMLKTKDFDFSFSGLKTAVLYEVKNNQSKLSPNYINNMSASFQQAAIDVLVAKTIKAAKKYRVKNVLLSGGVAANRELGSQMTEAIKKELPIIKLYIPEPKFCTDNGAMIAAVAFYKKRSALKQSWFKIEAQANLKLEF